MRRRIATTEAAPLNLLLFEGRRHRTEPAWVAAFDEFLVTREPWTREHKGEVLGRFEVDGPCPFDPARFGKRAAAAVGHGTGNHQ